MQTELNFKLQRLSFLSNHILNYRFIEFLFCYTTPLLHYVLLKPFTNMKMKYNEQKNTLIIY